ncbi:MAG: cyclic nucleotide-binding domain-containing protein [Ignavibacteriales bacterium]|nr:cyclic nucleotide-binding domain-containing protein [Ignavibacteriales bacterium]
METLQPILAEHPFFQKLEPEYLALITGCASNVKFDAGTYIFREGEEAHHFYLIRQGKVGLEIFIPELGPVTVQTAGEGELIGWSWLVPPYEWHFDGQALELTRAIALNAKCLRQKCEADHDLGYQLLKRFVTIMEQRLQATRLQLLDLYGSRT